MKRRKILIAILVGVMTLLMGCSTTKQTKKNPPGVIDMGGVECYIIQLPDKNLSNYFGGIGAKEDGIYVVDDLTGKSSVSTAVYFQYTTDGGYVFYTENSNVILYAPSTLAQKYVATCCVRLANSSGNSMSLSDAGEYIPYLKTN